MSTDKYPEHAKLLAVKDEKETVGDFIDWLWSQGYRICETDEHDRFWPITLTNDRIIANHFGINLEALDKEKQVMLDGWRERQSL